MPLGWSLTSRNILDGGRDVVALSTVDERKKTVSFFARFLKRIDTCAGLGWRVGIVLGYSGLSSKPLSFLLSIFFFLFFLFILFS
jgi:hypothetical protein